MGAYGEVEGVESEESRWPLEMVLDMIGVVLAITVVARAIGGLVSGLGVPSYHFALPASFRLQYGTSWADLISGLLLLVAIGLIALPRMVWDIPGSGRWSTLAPLFIVGIGVVATLTAVGAAIGTVNWIWNANRIAGPAEAINVADGLAAVVLAVLCTVLCWYAAPYLGVAEPKTELTQDRPPDPSG
jgi:hypothetical protein